MSSIIEIKNITKLYGGEKEKAARLLAQGADKETVRKKTGVTAALWDVNLSIPQGKVFVIIGLSGSGKSTLVRMINRLIERPAEQSCSRERISGNWMAGD